MPLAWRRAKRPPALLEKAGDLPSHTMHSASPLQRRDASRHTCGREASRFVPTMFEVA